MKVSYNPQNQSFKSKALTNTTEVAHYLTALAKRRPLKEADILDLSETVAKTEKGQEPHVITWQSGYSDGDIFGGVEEINLPC